MRNLILSCVLLSASACASLPQNFASSVAQNECQTQLDADTSMRIDVVRKLMEQRRLYAALAHLDDINVHTPQADYLRAEILRQSQRSDEAKPIYQALLNTCLQGEGYHGLGLIAGRENQLGVAVSKLSQAAKLLPLMPQVRNDYGYALLLMGELDLARREFLTALELDNGSHLAESNMVVLFLVEGNEQKAQTYAKHINMDSQTFAELKNQAEELVKSLL